MVTYYITDADGQIKLHDTDKARIETTLKFMPQYAGLELQETERPIENCEWADTPEYIAKKHKQEVSNQVASLEASTGLIRPLRETITAGQIPVSMYILDKLQEIEDLAQELREAQVAEQTPAVEEQEPELGPLED